MRTVSRSIPCILGGEVCPTPLYADSACRQTPLETEPPVDRMTDACEKITLPQTSFAGGQYVLIHKHAVLSKHTAVLKTVSVKVNLHW